MAFCNSKEEFSALLCDIPSQWRNAITEALDCVLNAMLNANLEAETNPSCDGIKNCETTTIFSTTIEDNIISAIYTNEKNITTISNVDLTEAINNALDEVDPKCLMSQEEWDALTYQERLNAIFNKVCCVHGDCQGNFGSGCGCIDCGDEEDVECIGLTACPCVTYQVSGTAPYMFSYKDCDSKAIVDYNSIDDNVVQVCAIRGTLVLPEGVFCTEIYDVCSDTIPDTTTTSTSSTSTTTDTTTSTSSTTTTTSSSTTTTSTIPPPTTTTSSTTTTTTILPPPTTTTTTSSSTTTTTTEEPIMGVANNTARYSNDNSVTHCSQPNNTIYTVDGAIFSGNIAYIDIYMTNPLTGYTFISDSALSMIYHIDQDTGLIGANSGQAC